MYLEILITLWVPFSMSLDKSEEFHCQPKPGCHVVKCDPTPGWKSRYSELERNEFPITCREKQGNSDEMMKILADTRQELKNSKQEIKTLHRLLDELREEENKKIQDLENKIESQEGVESLRSYIVKELDGKEDKIQALQKQFSSLPSRAELENIISQITKQLNEKEEKIQTLQEQISSLPSRHEVQHVQVNATDEKIQSLQNQGRCDFVYKGTCYWIEIHDSGGIDYEEAETTCNGRRSVLSYPVDGTHYELIMKEMRSKIPRGRNNVFAWTGLRVDPWTGDVTLATGGSAPYVKWYPGHPNRGSTRTNVYLWTVKNPADTSQGWYEAPPSHNKFGAICHYKLFEGN